MGDRVLFQCVAGANAGPALYCHWSGNDAPSIVRKLAERMKNRADNVDYASARLVQIAIDDDKYDTGFGVWNQASVLTEADTHGDAGCVVIHVDQGFRCECFGGYLEAGEDGFPKLAGEPR